MFWILFQSPFAYPWEQVHLCTLMAKHFGLQKSHSKFRVHFLFDVRFFYPVYNIQICYLWSKEYVDINK